MANKNFIVKNGLEVGGILTGGDTTLTGSSAVSGQSGLLVRDSSNTELLNVRNDGVVLINRNYLYVSATQGAYFTGSIKARGGIHNDQGDLSLSDNVTITGTLASGNITTTGYLRGPATFTIDPATHGDHTGLVVIAGDLQVDGTTTTINSTTVDVDDLNITVAKGAANAAAANTAGLTVDGADAQLKYIATGDKWTMNKPLDVTGAITSSGDVNLANNLQLNSRNFADSSDLEIARVNTSDQLLLGGGATATILKTAGGGNALTINSSGNATFAGTISSGAITSSGDSSVGASGNISMSAGSAGQFKVLGAGYTGAIALDANAMHIYHNSSSRDLILGTNETARLTIGGGGSFNFNSNNLTNIGTISSGVITATGGTSTQWNTAYGWGNHASGGYLPGSHDMTLTLSGDASGAATFTNMGNATLAVTVANDSHTHSNYVLKAGDTMTGKLTLNDAGYSLGNEYHKWKRAYSVTTSTPQEILYSDGNSLPTGGVYRFTAHIDGTGTDQFATAVYWNQDGTWRINVTGQSGTSSNHPEFIIDATTNKPTIHIDHSTTYSIQILAERIELSEGVGSDNAGYAFGTDAFLGSVNNNLYFLPGGTTATGPNSYDDGNVVWHTGNLTTTNKSNYDTAYTYSQVGHLPLAGGTLTGGLSGTTGTFSGAITATASNSYFRHADNAGIQIQTTAQGLGGSDGLRIGLNATHAFIWQYEALPLAFATSGAERLSIGATGLFDFKTNNLTNIGTISSGAITSSGIITATGGNSTQWNSAYSWGNPSGVYLPLAGGTLTGGLTGTTGTFSGTTTVGGNVTGATLNITATDTAGAGAMTTVINMTGYEGRGIGTFYQDTSYSGEEWYTGIPYAGQFNCYQIGYDEAGSQAEYSANSIARFTSLGEFQMGTTTVIDASRNLTNIGTISSGAIDSLTSSADIPQSSTANLSLVDTRSLAANTGGSIVFSGYYQGTTALNGGSYIKGYKENATSGDYGFGLKFGVRQNGQGLTDPVFTLNSSGNAIFTGTISSGAISASGDITTQGWVQHTGVLYSRNTLNVLNTAGNGWSAWATRGNDTFNLNVGTISSGAITSTGNLVLNATGHNYIEIKNSATSTKDWRIYNGQSWNPDALMIYNHTDDASVITIEPGKVGINRGASSISHTLDVGGNIAISATEIVDASRNLTSIGTYSGFGNMTTRAANVVIDAQSSADGQTVGFRAGYLAHATLAGHFRYTTGDAQLYIDNDFAGNNALYSTINFRNKANSGSSLITRLKIHGSSGNVDVTGSNFQMGGTTVISSSRLLENVTIQGDANGARLKADQWHQDSSGQGRFYFSPSSTMYIRSGAGFVFRDSADTGRATISNYGGLNVLSGGDGQVGSTVALAVSGTTVIDSSRNFYASNYGRTSHHTGYLVGGYNNVGSSGGKSSPIYSIGSAYTTSDTSLGNIYGIGYTTYSTALIGTIPGGNDWGMYVAAGGVGRVWLDGTNGNIGSVGGVYATNGYHVGTTTVIDASRNLTNIGSINAASDITFSGTQGLIRSHAKKYHWVSPVTVSNTTGTRQTQVFRLYYSPAHWTSDPINLDVELRSKYYENFSASFSVAQGYSQSEPEVFLKHQAFNEFNVRLVKGTKTSAGFNYAGQPVYYTDFYIWCNNYMTAWVELTSTSGFLTSNLTSGSVWGATCVNNSNGTNTTGNTPPALFAPNLGVGGMMDGKTLGVGNINLTGEAYIINSTSDGSDNGAVNISGGGAFGDTRGASIGLSGNENGNGGLLQLRAGDGSVGGIRLYTGGSERVRIDGNANLDIKTGALQMGTTTVIDASRNAECASYAIGTALPFANTNSDLVLNDKKLYLRGTGDNNHYLWNNASDWEELVAYTGTGFKITSSTGYNMATFSGTGAITAAGSFTSSGQITTSTDDIGTGENNGLRLINTNATTGTTWHMTAGTTGVDNYTFTLRNGATNVNAMMVSTSGNTTFAGTISSGATTISGVGTSSSAYALRVYNGAGTPDDLLSIKDDGTIIMGGPSTVQVTKGLGLYVTYNLGVSGLIYKTGGADVEVSGNLRVNSGGLKIGTTTVIDASRNLTNIGSINAAGDVTTPAVYLTNSGTKLSQSTGSALRITTPTGYMDIGSMNSGWIHFQGSLPYYFNQPMHIDNHLYPYSTAGARNIGGTGNIWNHVYAKGYFIDSTEVINSSRQLRSINAIYNTSDVQIMDLSHVTYTILKDPEGSIRMYLGDTGDAGNYYDNSAHNFRNRASAAQVQISDGGVNLQNTSATYKVQGTTVIDASRNITGASATFNGETILTQSGNNYVRVESAGAGEAMIRYNNTVSGYWYVGLRASASNSITTTGYHIFSATAGVTVAGWNADRNFYTSNNLTAAGNITAYSDERLKSDIQTLDGKKVLQMRGVSFTKDGEAGSGVIAQELEKIAPELVHDGEYKSVAYGNITGYLIELAKEQQKEIDELKLLVKQLIAN